MGGDFNTIINNNERSGGYIIKPYMLCMKNIIADKNLVVKRQD